MDAVAIPLDVVRALEPKCAGRPRWLEALPRLIAAYGRRWNLQLDGACVTSGFNACIVCCRDANERPVVLKLAPQKERAVREAQALLRWQASEVKRSVAVLEHDREGVVLLERLFPGTHVTAAVAGDALIAEALAELHGTGRPRGGAWPRLQAAVAAKWRVQEPAFHRLVAAGFANAARLDYVRERTAELLADPPNDVTLLHADLHPKNVLACVDRGAVLIDPRPYVGERAYDVATWITKQPDVERVDERAERFAELLSLSTERILGWTRFKALRTASIVFCAHPEAAESLEPLLWLAFRGRVRRFRPEPERRAAAA